MNEKIRLFVDMDGTLAEFKSIPNIETLYEEGYFRNLKPMEEVVQGIKEIVNNHKDIDVYIISCVVDSLYATEEKNLWIDKYLPNIPRNHRYLIPDGADKSTFIYDLKRTDYLLDDYNKNLHEWSKKGGSGIKLLNGINDNNKSWTGERIDCHLDKNIFCYTLVNKMLAPIVRPLSIKDSTKLAIESFKNKRTNMQTKNKYVKPKGDKSL